MAGYNILFSFGKKKGKKKTSRKKSKKGGKRSIVRRASAPGLKIVNKGVDVADDVVDQVIAVPANVFAAMSLSSVFKSAILASTTSINCALVICPTMFLSGLSVPFFSPAAFIRSAEAGGCLVIKVKLLSV